MSLNKKRPIFESGECRCCGGVKRCRLLNVEYEFRGQKEIYSDIFVDCFGLVLSHLDGEEEGRLICATCVTRLREANDFRGQVLRCEEKLLLSHIKMTEATHCDQPAELDVTVETEPKPVDLMQVLENCSDVDDETYVPSGDELNENSNSSDSQPLKRPLPNTEARPPEIQKVPNNTSQKPEAIRKETSFKITSDIQVLAERVPQKEPPTVCLPLLTRKNPIPPKNNTILPKNTPVSSKKTSLAKLVKKNNADKREMLRSIKRTKQTLKTVLMRDKSDIVLLQGTKTQKSTKAFSNTVTIVENSYVCPFISIFNDFYCDYCRQKFTDHQKLREHCMVHDPSTFKDVIMDSMRRMGKKKTQLDVQRIDCRLCPEKISDIESFKHHIATVHNKHLYPVDNEFLQFKVTSKLECIECGQSFELFQGLKKHMAEHFGAYTCDICGSHFFSEISLVNHIRNHDQTIKERHDCGECGRSFKLKYSRDMHVATRHKKEAAFQCIKCDASFFSARLRFKHMMDDHGERSTFSCAHCERVFDSRKPLLEHARRRHARLRHACGVCGKRFYLPCLLRDHAATHSGERGHRCDYCGKSYPRLKSLKVHLQSHELVKRFQCTLCNASYGQNVSLKNHMKRKHPRQDSLG